MATIRLDAALRCVAPVGMGEAGPRAWDATVAAGGTFDAAIDAAHEAACDSTSDDDTLCGEPATTDRIVEGIVCPLCAEHARELDSERADVSDDHKV